MLWILFVVIWGTLKLAGIRSSQVSNENSPDDDIWTFGQIMAVALVISPLFLMLGKFAEAALLKPTCEQALAKPEEQHQSSAGVIRHQTPLMADLDSLLDYNNMNSPPDSSTSPPGAMSQTLPSCTTLDTTDIDRDYYTTASWIWPCIASICGFILAVAILLLSFANYPTAPGSGSNGSPFTLANLWVDEWGLLYYCLLGYPSACIAQVVVGFQIDSWYSRHPSAVKWFLLFLLDCVFHAMYFMPVAIPLPVLHPAVIYAGIGVVLYAVYFLCQIITWCAS
jgi:hypothetical protein